MATVFHALIPHADGQRIALEAVDGGPRLPRVGPAEDWFCEVTSLDAAISARLGARAVALRWLELRDDPASGDLDCLYLMEALEEPAALPGALGWRGLDALPELPPWQRDAIARWRDERAGVRPIPALRAAWARPGWFAEAEAWLRDLCRRLGREVEGPVEQVVIWQRSSVLRLRTDRGAIYLKASPPMFAAEPALTAWLSARHPGLGPDVLAVDAARGWLAMEDLGGALLETCRDAGPWEHALRAFARIQRDSEAALPALRTLGVRERPLAGLGAGLDRLRAAAAALAPRYPGRLTPAALEALEARIPALAAACEELDRVGLPIALDHGDLHGNNIVVTGAGCRFFDWSDACLTHPFFALELFWFSVRKVRPDPEAEIARLMDAYLAAWDDVAPLDRLRRAAALAGELAPAHVALSYLDDILPGLEEPAEWEGAVVNALLELIRRGAGGA